jgi:hypothetical protein
MSAHGMSLVDLPAVAVWRHSGSREGYEAMYSRADDSGYRFDGHTVATEAGQAWVVRYAISRNKQWITTAARIWAWSQKSSRTVQLESIRWVSGRSTAHNARQSQSGRLRIPARRSVLGLTNVSVKPGQAHN